MLKNGLYAVERFEDGVYFFEWLGEGEAVQTFEMPEMKASELKAELFEGCVVYVEFSADGKIVSITVDREETEQRRKRLAKRLDSLFDN